MIDYTQATDLIISDEQNAWLHRNNHYGETAWRVLGFDNSGIFNPVNDECLISIGCCSRRLSVEDYRKLSSIADINAKWNEFEAVCRNSLYDGRKPRYRYFLWHFLFDFKKDDILLIPGNNGDFHVFQIVSDSVLTWEEIKGNYSDINTDGEHDFHYFWKVKPVRVNMSRSLLADSSLSSRLKFRGTTSKLDENLIGSLKTAVNTSKNIAPGLKAMEAAKVAFMESLQANINEIKFENLIRWYFHKKGAYTSRILPKNTKGDQDADIEAVFEEFRLKIYVQAKKHDKTVDIDKAYKQIQLYKEQKEKNLNHDGYTYFYWIVYSSMNEQQLEGYDTDEIRCISGNEFAEMLLGVGIADLDGAFFGDDR